MFEPSGDAQVTFRSALWGVSKMDKESASVRAVLKVRTHTNFIASPFTRTLTMIVFSIVHTPIYSISLFSSLTLFTRIAFFVFRLSNKSVTFYSRLLYSGYHIHLGYLITLCHTSSFFPSELLLYFSLLPFSLSLSSFLPSYLPIYLSSSLPTSLPFFISHPSNTTLLISIRPWQERPFNGTLKAWIREHSHPSLKSSRYDYSHHH